MASFRINPATGDLDISTGNLTFVTSNAEVTAAKLTALFTLWQGEWFRDGRLGFPYFTYVYVKNPQLSEIASLIRQVCLDCPGVGSISYINLDFDTRNRSLAATVAVVTNDGVLLTGGLGKPFIVTARGQ